MVRRLRRDEQGLVLVGALVIVALLFFMGTVMALAIESSLHTVSLIGQHDAESYAAESAVARGVAAAARQAACPTPPETIREIDTDIQFRAVCHPLPGKIVGNSITNWAVPSNEVSPLRPLPSIVLTGDRDGATFWTVLSWRRLDGAASTLTIQLGDQVRRLAEPGTAYVSFQTTAANPRFSISSAGGSALLSAFVVRAASAGIAKDRLVTVVGTAGTVVDEADVLLPDGGPPTLGLWRTVLP